MGELRAAEAVWNEHDNMYVNHYNAPAASSKAEGKKVASGTTEMPRKSGRPLCSKDKQPRKMRHVEIRWEYNGSNGQVGLQSATLGQTVRHDVVGHGILMQKPNPASATLSISGEDGHESLITVALAELQVSSAL